MIVSSREREKNFSSGEPGIQWPAIVTPIVAAAPISEASRILPLRSLYMYSPTKSAIGIVQAIVNVPQELPGTSCVTPAGSVSLRSDSANGDSAWPFVGVARLILKASLRVTSPPLG